VIALNNFMSHSSQSSCHVISAHHVCVYDKRGTWMPRMSAFSIRHTCSLRTSLTGLVSRCEL